MENRVYITNYNFKRITNGFEVPEDNNFKFDDTIIWTAPNGKSIDQNNPTALFAKWDINDLLLFKAFCKNTRLAVGTFYRKLEKPRDSFRYVQPEKSPSYHNNSNCERLHAEFEGTLIPQEIWDQGIEKVKEFRKWWNDHEQLRMENPEAFVARINLVFHTSLKGFEVEKKNNSGVKEFDNVTIEKINDSIFHKFNDLFSWAKEDKKRTDIFVRFAYLSYLGNTSKHIMNNPTSYSEMEIKEILKYIHPQKLDIIKDLKNLYLKTYNPELGFERTLLDELGFEPCAMCYTLRRGSELLSGTIDL